MRNHAVAEWVLSRFMSHARAEAVVGDLIEASGQNASRFRRLLLATLCSLGCRSALAFTTAAMLGGAALCGLQILFFGSNGAHPFNTWEQAWGSSLALVSGWLWIVTFFSAVRYGIQDIMTRLTLALAILGSLTISFWWLPFAPVIALLCFMALAATSTAKAKRRPTLKVLAFLVVLLPFMSFSALIVLMTPLAYLLKHMRIDLAIAKPIAMVWLAFCYLAVVGMACTTCTKVRRWAWV